MPKLIIVEGIPGSGKSWTARFIATQLERNGHPAKLLHETAYEHPIIFWEHIDDPSEWMERFFRRWKDFVTYVNVEKRTVILEAACFQYPIMSLLNFDIGRTTISAFIQKVLQELQGIESAMVYLYQNDQLAAIRQMCATRGGQAFLKEKFEALRHYAYYVNRDSSSPDLHVTFLQEYAGLVRACYGHYPWNSIGIETSDGNWLLKNKQIAAFLGLTYLPDPVLQSEQLQRFVGEYRNDEIGLNVTISMTDDGLTIFDDKQLRVFDECRFYLDAINVRVDFVMEGDRVKGLVVWEKDIFVNKKDEGTWFYRIHHLESTTHHF